MGDEAAEEAGDDDGRDQGHEAGEAGENSGDGTHFGGVVFILSIVHSCSFGRLTLAGGS